MLRVALDGNDVDRVRLVRAHGDREPEVGRQVPADLVPRVAGVVAAHDVPVLLHEQHARPRRVHREAVDAVADLGPALGDARGVQAAVHRSPRLPAVGRAEQGGVLHPSVGRVRIGQRGFAMPDPRELRGVRRAVVPLVRGERLAGFGRSGVTDLVAHRLPSRAAVVGALDHLPEPAAGLRRIQPIRVSG